MSITNTNQLMLCREIIAVCTENNVKHRHTVCAKWRDLNITVDGVPDYKGSQMGRIRGTHKSDNKLMYNSVPEV